tara:strand:- start:52 stop:513 length:462 start_codon:yes stop_codon:yes gene_type:complete
MDIQISSNFERYLFDLAGQSSEKLKRWMQDFESTGKLTIEGNLLENAKSEFVSASVTNRETVSTIRNFFQETGYILDPHTAVGVCAAAKTNIHTPKICLACAHYAKFAETIQKALGNEPELPKELAILKNLETNCKTVPAFTEKIKDEILQRL